MTQMNRPEGQLPFPEFIGLMAFLFATVALAIDTMLPAMPEIAAQLSPDMPNRAVLVVASFVLGMGVGTFFTGPMADAWGRRPVILWGLALYIAGAVVGFFETSLYSLLMARFLQGLGAAGPRVAAMAILRDLYSGRRMAKLISMILIVFMMVPAVAPAMGALILSVAHWRAIFGVFVLFAALCMVWFGLRQPETLAPAQRRPFGWSSIRAGLADIAAQPRVLIYIAVLALVFAMLFGMIQSIQPIMDQRYDRGDSFPFWFALIAVIAGSAGFLNASLVMRLGMRLLVSATFVSQAVFAALALLGFTVLDLSPGQEFALFMIWAVTVFFQTGLTVGNLNALAMEPLGHIAGLAASVVSAVATVLGGALSIPLSMAFDGTARPLAAGFCALALLGVLLMLFSQSLPGEDDHAPDPERAHPAD